jgi:hypothetical protein
MPKMVMNMVIRMTMNLLLIDQVMTFSSMTRSGMDVT